MKKIIISAIFVIIITVAIFGTSAYYSDGLRSDDNPLEAGVLDVVVRETRIDPETGALVSYSGTLPAMPGVSCSKIVTVCNEGTVAAYVRIGVSESFELTRGTVDVTDTGLITWELNSQYWALQDGYYYYRTPLEAGSETEPLFTQITFAAEMDDTYEGSRAIVTVCAQTVQTTDNGTTVFEAIGWPSEEMGDENA